MLIILVVTMLPAEPVRADMGAQIIYNVYYYSNGIKENIKTEDPAFEGVYKIKDTKYTQILVPGTAAVTYTHYNTQPDGSGINYIADQYIFLTGNFTLYAQWDSSHLRKITYNPNGGEGDPEPCLEVLNTSHKVVDKKYKRTGYTFSHYTTDSNGYGTRYDPGTSFNVDKDVTLYAQWAKNVKLLYYPNGGNGSTITDYAGKNVSFIMTTMGYTRTDYTLTSFNTKANGSGVTYAVGASCTLAADTDLYAQWTRNKVKISYDSNGGIGQASDTVDSNTTYTVKNIGITRDGFIFSGYNTEAGGGGTQYAVGATFNASANITLYAQWVPDVVTIKYHPGLGQGSEISFSVNKYSIYTVVQQPSYTRADYAFTNYNTQQNGSGTAYFVGSSLNASANITLYAQWALDTVTVTYNPGLGSGQEIILNVIRNSTYEVVSQDYDMLGYRLAGFNTQADGSGLSFAVGTSFKVKSNITLYAQWTQKDMYGITYKPNYPKGGIGSETVRTSYDGENHRIENRGYTRPGYIFTGKYNTSEDGTGTTYEKEQLITITSDIVLYAMWEKSDVAHDDTLKAVVTKVLKVPRGTSVPTTAFSFHAERLSEDDKAPTNEMPEIIINDINYSEQMNEGEYAYTDSIGNSDCYYLESNDFLKDIVWPYPGIFRYKITETKGSFAGENASMNYSRAEYSLTVVISNEDKKPADGLLDVVQLNAIIQKSDDGSTLSPDARMKVNPNPGGDGEEYFTSEMIFTNEYRDKAATSNPTNPYNWKLSVSNNVSGLISDQTHYFEYSMTITAPGDDTANPSSGSGGSGNPSSGNSGSGNLSSGNGSPENPYIAYVVEIAGFAPDATYSPAETDDPNAPFEPKIPFDPNATYRIPVAPQTNRADSDGIIRFVSGESKTFYLKHGQYLVFLDLPTGAGYMVAETADPSWLPGAYITNGGVSQGYESSHESITLTIPQASNETFKEALYIGDETASIDFINTRNEYIDTGLNLNFLPFLGIIALTLCALITYVTIKRRPRRS